MQIGTVTRAGWSHAYIDGSLIVPGAVIRGTPLFEGDKVEYRLSRGLDGRERAVDVKVIERDTP